MKILFGVNGEGVGHATRSQVVIDYLLEKGHEVTIITSKEAYLYFKDKYNTKETSGLNFVIKNNKIKILQSLFVNFFKSFSGIPKNIIAYFNLDFKPDVIINDFDSWTYFYAKVHRIPIICIDNIQLLSRCKIDKKLYKGYKKKFNIVKALITSKLPACDQYLVPTFFKVKTECKKTKLVAPILRKKILSTQTKDKEHVLVYKAESFNRTFFEKIFQHGHNYIVYGKPPIINWYYNVEYKKISEDEFIKDLASCKAVISSAGFSLISEALYYNKPILLFPIDNQIEQIINARIIENLGCGLSMEENKMERVKEFFKNLEFYKKNCKKIEFDDNKTFFKKIDAFMSEIR